MDRNSFVGKGPPLLDTGGGNSVDFLKRAEMDRIIGLEKIGATLYFMGLPLILLRRWLRKYDFRFYRSEKINLGVILCE